MKPGKQYFKPRPRPGSAPPHRPGSPQPSRRPPEDDGIVQIWGAHAVEAAFANPARVIHRVWATENAAHRFATSIAERRLTPEPVQPKDLDRKLGADTVHQGVLIEADPLSEPELAALAENAVDGGPIVLLDQVTDPHNVGAIMRSAAVFGSAGIVMTRRHSPPLGGALAKAASGALEVVPLALIGNLSRAMTDLKDAGAFLIGLDGTADMLLEDALLGDQMIGKGLSKRPLAIVLGAEGRGLRQLTAENCDLLCRIASTGPLASLNVSNAAAVALHLTSMHRRRSKST